MKQILVFSLLFMGFVAVAKTMFLEEAKAFLEDEKKSVGESGMPPRRTPQDLAFHRFVAEDWKRALTLLENDAPDLRRQNLIVVVAEVLPAQDYVQFLNGVCALVESGKLQMSGCCFLWGSFLKNGFLAYNYDQPEVATVIDRIEAIYKVHEPGKLESYFSEIKSGETKKFVIRDCTNYGEPMPETYKSNSTEAYRRLMKEHTELLAEEAKKAKGKIKPESAPKERKTVRIAEEDGSVRIALIDDDPPEDDPVEDNTVPWKLPFVIGTLVISSIVVAWYCFRKKKKCEN